MARLPADLRRRWQEVCEQPWVDACVHRWMDRAPAALTGLTSVREVDERIGQLWLQRRGEDLDEAMRALLVSISGSGREGELAFLVLLRRLALVVVKLAERYGLDVASVAASLWLLAADYPLERRPQRIALNLVLDLRKGIGRQVRAARAGSDLTGLSQDVEVLCRQDCAQRFLEVAAGADPAWLVQAHAPVHQDPTAVHCSALPAADIVEGLLQWAAGTVPVKDVQLLRLVYATGRPRRTPLEEVAQQLGMSEQTIRQRLRRAMKRLSAAVCAASEPAVAVPCRWRACRLHREQGALQAA